MKDCQDNDGNMTSDCSLKPKGSWVMASGF